MEKIIKSLPKDPVSNILPHVPTHASVIGLSGSNVTGCLGSRAVTQITNYDCDKIDTTGLGWVRPGDPRSELVLSLFKEGTGLPLMLNGLSSDLSKTFTKPDAKRVAAISPMAQLRMGKYTTPTFLIHGDKDEVVPFHTAVRFADALTDHGVHGGLLAVKGVKHIHDMSLRPGMERWQREVAPGYDFLFQALGRRT